MMKRRRCRPFSIPLSYLLLLLLCAITIHTHPVVAASEAPPPPITSATSTSTSTSTSTTTSTTDLEDEILLETIHTPRGHRDAPGVRDQWDSTEHLRSKSSYDVHWRPPSPKAERLLKLYRLGCEGCSDGEAVSKINEYVSRTKEEARERERRERWSRWGWGAARLGSAVGAAACAWFFLFEEEGVDGGGGVRERSPVVPIPEAPVVVRRPPSPPTWLDNERREVWSAKQEKLFGKALREFGGVGKKERYVLIAEKVPGKSRIECLTHHRMQILEEEYERRRREEEETEEEEQKKER